MNITLFDWESEFPSSNISSIDFDTTEYLHHTLIGVLLLEEAFIYLLISSLFRELERDEDFRQYFARIFRFLLITVLDVCAIVVHKIIVDENTLSQYPLRVDGLFLICLNLVFLAFFP